MSRLVFAAVAVAMLGGARVAAADDKAECSFLEFTSTTAKDPSVDPALKPLEKKFGHAPFATWNSFKLQTKVDKTLARSKSEPVTLKVGTASVILRERSEKRVNLGLTLDGADGKRVLDAKPDLGTGEWLVIGENVTVANAKDDGHFLAMMCK